MLSKTGCLWFLVVTAPSLVAAQLQTGDQVCAEGYIMDTYCINRKKLLDNDDVFTLEGPEKHSIHCLVDVSWCRDGGFEVLMDPVEGGTTHCRGFKLDKAGTDMAIQLARDTGEKGYCTSCNGSPGSQTHGFRATVRGTVSDVGDENTPATVVDAEVLPSSAGCENVIFSASAASCDPGPFPTSSPSAAPVSPSPTAAPSRLPVAPSSSDDPTEMPTQSRTPNPTSLDNPLTPSPTAAPSRLPVAPPPSDEPTETPTPSRTPTSMPLGFLSSTSDARRSVPICTPVGVVFGLFLFFEV